MSLLLSEDGFILYCVASHPRVYNDVQSLRCENFKYCTEIVHCRGNVHRRISKRPDNVRLRIMSRRILATIVAVEKQ